VVPSSFRDPSGFTYLREGQIFRQINVSYKVNYDYLVQSSLLEELISSEMLIPQEEVDYGYRHTADAYLIIKPSPIPFVSYPYEWCFGQLKAAALHTLNVQRKALAFDMSLKDSSAYNIQFKNGKPILIDTLSFERYKTGVPWVGFGQFCRHFLAPLTLMSYRHVELGQMLKIYIDGIPLDLASCLLPYRSWLAYPILTNIHLHSKSQKYYADTRGPRRQYHMSPQGLHHILDGLEAAVQRLRLHDTRTQWAHYYDSTNYRRESFEQKKERVRQFVNQLKPSMVWDLGSNVGIFSRIACEQSLQTVSFDADPAAVDANYERTVQQKETNLLPLLLDLTNPSPGIGWAHEERESLEDRGPADLVMCLALIHHLAISNNTPFHKIAQFLSRIGKHLIIEFVPKSDSQVQKLLATREDIYDDYTQAAFEAVFAHHWIIESLQHIRGSDRVLYLMRRR